MPLTDPRIQKLDRQISEAEEQVATVASSRVRELEKAKAELMAAVERGEISPDDPRIAAINAEIASVLRASTPDRTMEEEEDKKGHYVRYHMEFNAEDQPVQITKRQMQMLLLEANIRED